MFRVFILNILLLLYTYYYRYGGSYKLNQQIVDIFNKHFVLIVIKVW